MKERPILMSAPKVCALLNGSKTQTRRMVKPQPIEEDGAIYDGKIKGPEMYEPCIYDKHGEMVPGPEIFGIYTEDGEWGISCPYGQPGDQLWVRETFCDARHADAERFLYRADGDKACRWTPSIFMPRNASRIQLEITNIGIERLQAINETDAIAEGMNQTTADKILSPDELQVFAASHILCPHARGRLLYETLWESINGAGSWDANPWVWVVEFRRIKP